MANTNPSLVKAAVDALTAKVNTVLSKASDGIAAAESALLYRDAAQSARDAAQGSANAAYANAQDVASALVYQNLAGVMASYNLNLVDAFVYDTTKDFMGGLWRYQCQGKSWFDEEGAATGRWFTEAAENDARAAGAGAGDYYCSGGNGNFYMLHEGSGSTKVYRGSRREFPAHAIITAEAGRVVIWDGDDPSLPMWMVFNGAGSWTSANILLGRNTSSVTALNGQIYIGCNGGAGYPALYMTDFLSDLGKSRTAVDDYGGFYKGNIAQRNDGMGYKGASSGSNAYTDTIVHPDVNDVAMTVLPGAPIDPETGMPIPTIAVATDGGVSVIRDDGTVVSKSYVSARCTSVLLDGKSAYVNGVGPDAYNAVWRWDYVTDTVQGYGGNGNLFEENFFGNSDGWRLAKSGDTLIGGENGYRGFKLRLLHEDKAKPLTSMIAHIASSYATGWMAGDTKGCWLASTDASDLVGEELVTNGGFDSNDLTGWVAETGNVSAAVVDGALEVTNNGAGWFYLAIPTEVGKSYHVQGDFIEKAGSGRMFVGPVVGNGSLVSVTNPGFSANNTFVATSTTTYITLGDQGGGTGNVNTYDNFSVRRADPDRSVNGKGLAVHGTVTRTPVAEGAELMGFSGFSASNYLEQPYNPDLDFGTGDFCVMGWGYNASISENLLCLEHPSAGNGFTILPHYGGDFGVFTGRGAYNNLKKFGPQPALSQWFFFFVARQNGNEWSGGINGNVFSVQNATYNGFATGSELFVGKPSNITGGAWGGSAALIRHTKTVPTPEQIAKIYRDEKKLFQPGAACTLYGDSDAVTALAHDDDKGLLLAGTSGGLSRFDGLLRVSHDDTPITTTIAAGAGYEVAQ